MLLCPKTVKNDPWGFSCCDLYLRLFVCLFIFRTLGTVLENYIERTC